MTITRYRKGQLSVPYLYCPSLDTLAGNLQLRRAGILSAELAETRTEFYKDVRLGTDEILEDSSGNVLLAGDNSGHIDQLARIDVPVTNPTASHEVTACPAVLSPSSQSGTITENSGRWVTATTDILYLYLGGLLQMLMMKGTVVIESITVYMNSTNGGDYIDDIYLYGVSAITGSNVSADNEPADIGNGSTGDENGIITVNRTLVTGNYYRLAIHCIIASASIVVRGIKIKYHLV